MNSNSSQAAPLTDPITADLTASSVWVAKAPGRAIDQWTLLCLVQVLVPRIWVNSEGHSTYLVYSLLFGLQEECNTLLLMQVWTHCIYFLLSLSDHSPFPIF